MRKEKVHSTSELTKTNVVCTVTCKQPKYGFSSLPPSHTHTHTHTLTHTPSFPPSHLTPSLTLCLSVHQFKVEHQFDVFSYRPIQAFGSKAVRMCTTQCSVWTSCVPSRQHTSIALSVWKQNPTLTPSFSRPTTVWSMLTKASSLLVRMDTCMFLLVVRAWNSSRKRGFSQKWKLKIAGKRTFSVRKKINKHTFFLWKLIWWICECKLKVQDWHSSWILVC